MLAICIPSGNDWKADFALSYGKLIRSLTEDGTPHIVINIRSSDIYSSRNNITDQALESGATELLWLDSDLHFPADVYSRLKSEDKDFIGATYLKRSMSGELTHVERPENTGADIEEVFALPGGCNLIQAKVYETVAWPWYAHIVDTKNRVLKGEDFTFSIQARKAGFSIWVHRPLSVELNHMAEVGLTFTDFPKSVMQCPPGYTGYTPFVPVKFVVHETKKPRVLENA